MVTWIGLDIAKDTIDVGFFQDDIPTHFKIKNSLKGFQNLVKNCPPDSKFVMEATGIYYLKCARYLDSLGAFVSVENPLKIKRFSEMSLRRTKTDKKDALLIARYAENSRPHCWRQPSEEQLKSQEIQSVIKQYTSVILRMKNEIHAFSNSGLDNKLIIKSLTKTIAEVTKSKVKLEKELYRLIQASFPEELRLITSIPAIGINTACLIIGKIGDGSSFERSGQLASYFGITPVESYSGTSINKKGVISRMGSPRIRASLYMCGVSALRCNPMVVAMNARMSKNGKHIMKIIIAAMNKLVRQVFGVLKSGKEFDPNFYVKSVRI